MAIHREMENKKRDCAISLTRMDRVQRGVREKGERIRRENKGGSAARVDSSGILNHKNNTYSIWDPSCNKIGLGILVSNNSSRCVQAWAIARERVINLVVAEVDAVHAALLLSQQSGWRKVEIQVDIKAPAESFQVRANPVIEASAIAEDIYLLQLMFECCTFSFMLLSNS